MRMTLKRLTAWMLTLMMVIGCVPAYAADGNVVDYSDSTSAYDVMPQDDSTSEKITITFVVNNEYYVKDPNSGNTHLRVLKTTADAFKGGDLTYIDWTGTKYYKITSTGKVCTVSIPSGSTLKDERVTLPALDVFNCNAVATSQDGYRYTSVRGWVTEDGTVCNASTVFTEDTTLYLQLDDGNAFYTIDFVCGEDNHSIAASGPFQLGQTLAENYMTEATVAANKFTSDSCAHGPASNEVLSAWQLHNYKTGSRVDLSADLVITSDYATTQYGSAIKAYAVWEPGVKISFKYVAPYNNTLDLGTLVVKPGAKFGDIQGIPNPNNYIRDTFIGWQYTDTAGNLRYATEDTVISAGMEFNAIFGTPVYARFQYTHFDEMTQGNVTEIVEERARLSGDALGTLPTLTDYGIDSVVWQYTDADGNEQTATTGTVITEDTVYTAVFAEVPCGSVVIHDILPDGTESGVVLDFSVPEGMTLAGAIEDNDTDIEEGKLLSECVWRTVDGELADMNAVVVAGREIHLYTHTYQIVLTLNLNEIVPAAFTSRTRASVNTDPTEDGTITMTITAREGEKLTENDFIVNGTDLTQYAWTDGSGNAINLRSLIDKGVTGSITATSNGTLVSTDVTLSLTLTLDGTTKTYTITKPEDYFLTEADFIIDGLDLRLFTWKDAADTTVDLADLVGTAISENTLTSDGSLDEIETRTANIDFFVCIDDEWVSETRSVTAYWIDNSWYITSAQLQSVYGKYGFPDDVSQGTKYFPHSTGDGNLWGNREAMERDGIIYIPVVNIKDKGPACDVYYTPSKNVTNDSGMPANNAKTGNVFYTVKVEDPSGLVYNAGNLPDTIYTLVNKTATMTVKTAGDVSWQCVGLKTGATVNPTNNNEDGTVTFRIDSITEPYIISIAGSEMVVYDLNLPQTPADEEYGKPLVNGEEAYVDVLSIAAASEYTVLGPNPSSYFYKSGRYLGEATFLGWAVNSNTTKLVQPGAQLDDLSKYDGQVVTLTAQWETKLGGTTAIDNSPMINFFVALNAVSEGTTSWVGNIGINYFTESVYTVDCGVTGKEVVDQKLYTSSEKGNSTQYYILGGTSGTNLSDNHNTITRNLTNGYTKMGDDGNSYTFRASFPSDETVLKNVRAMVDSGKPAITINGRTISSDELNTTNFTVKWYVFKYDDSDGWHIDGILVAKTAELQINKTFAGDEDTIEEIKKNYYISVTGESTHTGGTLTTSSEGVVKNGNTYTWTVPVDQYYDYVITENKWQIDDDSLTTSSSQYRVRNSVNGQNTGGWATYNDGITVTGQGHNEQDDDRLTVDFLNTYTAPGTVILQKVDAVTGNLMPGVKFNIDKTMYDLSGGRYSADPNDQEKGTETKTITTNSAGQAYLWIGGGTYTLTEEVPTGYDDPGVITAVLQGDKENDYRVVEITSASAAKYTADRDFVSIDGDDKLTLIVKNYSRTIDLKVTKDWVNNENKPVTIQLYRDGKPMGADYTVTLDGSENWTHTFNDLPLYADGGLAQYSLREESIGDAKYSSEYTGGYRYYDVNCSGMRYLDENDNVTDNMTAVETIALDVTNRRNQGLLTIRKVDDNGQPLQGAEFKLYAAPENETTEPNLTDETQLRTVTSDSSGNLIFSNLDAGRYYLKETKTPEGYITSGRTYCLEFSGDAATLKYWDDNAWTTVTNNQIVNTSNTTSISVKKNWADYENAFNTRPASITLTLTGKVGTGDAATVVSVNRITLSTSAAAAVSDDAELIFLAEGASEQAWSHTFTNLPTHYGGQKINYTVSEPNAGAGYTSSVTGNKTDGYTVTNTLKTYTLDVTKQIEGNFADPNAEFTFTAKLKAADGSDASITTGSFTNGVATFTLSGGKTQTLTGIPHGCYVEVTETSVDGYTVQYMLGQNKTPGTSCTLGAIFDSNQGVTFINTKNVTVDTGVDLDSLPYAVLLLGAVGIAVVWLLLYLSRRKED